MLLNYRISASALVIPPEIKGVQKWSFLGKLNEDILMRTSKFTDAQIMSMLRQAEGGVPVADVCPGSLHITQN